MGGCFTLFLRDIRLALRQGADLGMVLAFFLICAALFPLGVGPDPQVLARIASGVIWVLALLAVMLSLDRLFHNDYEDGALELMALSPQPLYLLVLAKVAAHWVTTCLPLIILAPVLGIMLQLQSEAYGTMMIGLLLGTPVLSLIGSVGAALSLGARRAGLLVATLVLPLYVPVLIFGITAIDAALNGFPVRPHLLLLAAILAGAVPLAPLATAAAIRQAVE